jgi:hypothetical protein
MAEKNDVFDYKKLMALHKSQLWERIADYAHANKETKVREIARLFNTNRRLVWYAMRRNGLKRMPGRQSFHFPPKVGE